MSIIDRMKGRIRGKGLRILFPEGSDARIRAAVEILLREDLARPIVLFETRAAQEAAGPFPAGTECLCTDSPDLAAYWAGEFLARSSAVSEKRLLRAFPKPLDAAAIMLAAGAAEAMVGGLLAETAEVILAAYKYVGLSEGIDLPSSLFLMRLPGFAGSEGELIVFADCGVTPAPDSAGLAQIALTTARSVEALLGWEPRVAFLSFSTDGSAEHESVTRVQDAVKAAQALAPGLRIDGEFQLDAAIVPEVAVRKLHRPSEVAGRANILIFPDLNAGNIAYKAVQRFARADAFGPLLQGFRASVSDLSRGSSVADVLGVSVMALARVLGRPQDEA